MRDGKDGKELDEATLQRLREDKKGIPESSKKKRQKSLSIDQPGYNRYGERTGMSPEEFTELHSHESDAVRIKIDDENDRQDSEELVAAKRYVVVKSFRGEKHLAEQAFSEFISEYPESHVQNCTMAEYDDGAVYEAVVVCRPGEVEAAR